MLLHSTVRNRYRVHRHRARPDPDRHLVVDVPHLPRSATWRRRGSGRRSDLDRLRVVDPQTSKRCSVTLYREWRHFERRAGVSHTARMSDLCVRCDVSWFGMFRSRDHTNCSCPGARAVQSLRVHRCRSKRYRRNTYWQ